MRTLSLLLLSLGGILALENGSDNKGVGAAPMPECAVKCIKEHVPNSGCDLLHVTCLCGPDFRVKHGPIIAPCLIALCDANEISKVENAWRGQCEGSSNTREYKENARPAVEEDTSTAAVVSASLATSSSTSSETSSSISSSTPKRTPTPTPKSSTSSTTSSISSSERGTESTSSTTTSTATGASKPTPTPTRTPVPNSRQSGQGLTTGAKAGIGIGVSFGVVGMACLGATLWLRTRTKAPPVTPAPVIEDVGKAELPATTARPLHVSEIDGREAPQELAA